MKRTLAFITLFAIIAGACSKNNDTQSASPLSHADSVRIADSVRGTNNAVIKHYRGTLVTDGAYGDYPGSNNYYPINDTMAEDATVTFLNDSTLSISYTEYIPGSALSAAQSNSPINGYQLYKATVLAKLSGKNDGHFHQPYSHWDGTLSMDSTQLYFDNDLALKNNRR